MKLSILATAAWLALAAAPAAQAQALPITGGITAVTLTAAPTLTAVGLSVAPLGSALVSPGSAGIPIAFFPITGGSIDTVTFAGSILHDGSGLALSSTSATVNLTNFVIDTTSGLLSGNVAVGGSALGVVPLFNIGSSGVATSPFSLALTSAAAGALSTVFGIPNLTGAVLGTANTIPITSAVPEPATVASMLAGMLLVGSLARRNRRA
jgi:PEP-CTERM motif